MASPVDGRLKLLEVIHQELEWLRGLDPAGESGAFPEDRYLASEYLQCVKLLPLVVKEGLEEGDEESRDWLLLMDRVDGDLWPVMRTILEAELSGEEPAHRDLVEAVAVTERAFAHLWSWLSRRSGLRPEAVPWEEIRWRRQEMFEWVSGCLPGTNGLTEGTVRSAALITAYWAEDMEDPDEMALISRTHLLPALEEWNWVGSVRSSLVSVIITALSRIDRGEERGAWVERHWDLVDAVCSPGEDRAEWVVSATGLLAAVAREAFPERREALAEELADLLRSWDRASEGDDNIHWALNQILQWTFFTGRQEPELLKGVMKALSGLRPALVRTLIFVLHWVLRLEPRQGQSGRARPELGRQGLVPAAAVGPLVSLALERLVREVDDEHREALDEVLEVLCYQAVAVGQPTECWRVVDALRNEDEGRWTGTVARAAGILAVVVDEPAELDALARLAADLGGGSLEDAETTKAYADLVVSLAERLRRRGTRADAVISRLERSDVDADARKTLDEALAWELWLQLEDDPDAGAEEALELLDRLRTLRARSRVGGVTMMHCVERLLHRLPSGHPRRNEVELVERALRAEIGSLTRHRSSALVPRSEQAEERVEADVIDTIQAGLRSPGPEEGWPFQPVYPGGWREPEPAEAARLLRILLAIPEAWALIQVVKPYLMRVDDPPFYSGVSFVELAFRQEDGRPASLCFLVSDGHVARLVGESPPIHELNATGPVDLGTAERMDAYLRFFCMVVCGEEGSFSVVDEVGDLAFQQDLESEDRDKLEQVISPVELRMQGPVGRAVCTLQYSNALFRSQMEIKPGGMVEMSEDEVLVREMPVLVHGFWGGIRQLRKP